MTKDEMERWIDTDPTGIKLNPSDYLLTEIVEKILCYLNVIDLCDASLVSHDWYDIIANSVKCMRKIQLKCHGEVPEDFDVPRNSIRKYEAIRVAHKKPEMFEHAINFITTSKKRWRTIDMNSIVFDTKEQYLEFSEAIAPTLEQLVMVKVTIKQSVDASTLYNVKFPRLRELEVKNCNALINRSFGNVERLTYLHINHGKDRSAAQVVRHMLRSCKGLKNLSIGGDIFCEVFEELSNDIPFILTLLSVHCFDNPPSHSMVRRNFNKFLIVHRKTLRCIYVDAYLGKNVQDNIYYAMNVPNVTFLD
ncbi:unnamed protein product [Diamesa serratosioi]